MAKSERKIIQGVWVNGTLYTEGMEDELEEAMAPSQYERLSESGALEGKWSPGGEEPQPLAGSEEKQAKRPKPAGATAKAAKAKKSEK